MDNESKKRVDAIKNKYDAMRKINIYITNFRIYKDHVSYNMTDDKRYDCGDDFDSAIYSLENKGYCIFVNLRNPEISCGL